MWGDINF